MANGPNKGVVLYLASSTTPTYVDRKGDTRNAVAILTTYLASDAFEIGASQDCFVTIQSAIGGVTSFEFALLVKAQDPPSVTASGITWRFQKVQLERLHDGNFGTACVHTISADPTEPDGATAADLGYATTSHRTSGTAKLIAKYTGGAPNGSTKLIASVHVA